MTPQERVVRAKQLAIVGLLLVGACTYVGVSAPRDSEQGGNTSDSTQVSIRVAGFVQAAGIT